jgi:ribosomal protein S8
MFRISVPSDALKSINAAEKQGKRQVIIRPSFQVIVKSLELMQKNGHVSELVAAKLSSNLPPVRSRRPLIALVNRL